MAAAALELESSAFHLRAPHERLLELARSHGPLRRELAAVAGRIVATKSWERIGFARLADYARERIGLSARQLHDLAHVDERLRALPRTEAALRSGVLSWTKARLVARAARAEDEAEWIAAAGRMTTRALEREVRTIDCGAIESGGLDDEEAGRRGIVVSCTPQVQAKFHRARRVARRVAGEGLPTWACMEAVAAEALSALPEVAADAAPVDPSAISVSAPARASVCAKRTAASTEPPVECDAFALDARLRELVAREQGIEAAMAPLLSASPHLAAYAEISPRKARALVRLERANARVLLAAFRSGRLSWVQASALVGLISLPEAKAFAERWVAWAQRVSVRRLYEDVDEAFEAVAAGRSPSPPDDREPTDDSSWQTRAKPMDSGEPQARADETARFFFSAPDEVNRFLRAVLCSIRRRLDNCSEGEAWGWLFDHALEAWGANDPRVQREHRVFARDGWRCTVPGCTSYRNLHDHHIVFRSAGGDDELANRTTLCAYHHLRGVHAGRVRVIGQAPARLRFELGLRPQLRPLLVYRSGE